MSNLFTKETSARIRENFECAQEDHPLGLQEYEWSVLVAVPAVFLETFSSSIRLREALFQKLAVCAEVCGHGWVNRIQGLDAEHIFALSSEVRATFIFRWS